MRDYFDELNDNVNLLSDVANDMISLFSNEGLAQIKIEKYRKCKRICMVIKILTILCCGIILYRNFH